MKWTEKQNVAVNFHIFNLIRNAILKNFVNRNVTSSQ